MSVIPPDLVVYAALGVPAWDGSSTISASATAGATGFAYAATNAASGFPPPGGYPIEFPVVLTPAGGTQEIMWVTQNTNASSTASGNLTVIRGFAGTTAASAAIGATISMFAGGPVDFLSRISFTDYTSNDFADIVSSSGADVTQISLTARNPAGSIVYNQSALLNNTTPVTGIGAQQFERFLAAGVGAWTTLVSAVSSVSAPALFVAGTTAQTVPFYAMVGRELCVVTSGASGQSWGLNARGALGTTATLHSVGDHVYVMPKGDVAIYAHTAVLSGTCTAASSGGQTTTPPLMQLAVGHGAQTNIGNVVRTTGGTGPNQIRYVVAVTGYGTDVIAVNRDFSPALAGASTTYAVLNGFVLETVTSAGTGSTVAIPISNIQRAFWNDSADVPGGVNRNYYQKAFQINNNTVTDFTNASVLVAGVTGALPAGANLSLALTTASGDVGYVANRQTLPPAGITAFSGIGSPVTVVANGGTLLHSGVTPASASAQGLWLNLSLVSGTAAYKGAADVRVQGTTT